MGEQKLIYTVRCPVIYLDYLTETGEKEGGGVLSCAVGGGLLPKI
jgi:hypothetical protein